MAWPSHAPRRRRATGAVLVVLAHVLVAWWVGRAVLQRPAAPGPVRLTEVWLLPAPVQAQRQPAAQAAPAPRVIAKGLKPQDTLPVPDDEQGTPAAPAGTDAAALATGTSPSPGVAGTAGPAPLVLVPSRDVLRGALANPATSDPRANSPKPTAQERMAMAIDPMLCIKQDRLPDGTVTRRWGRLALTTSTIEATTGHKGLPVGVCQ